MKNNTRRYYDPITNGEERKQYLSIKFHLDQLNENMTLKYSAGLSNIVLTFLPIT